MSPLLRNLISPSARFALKEMAGHMKVLAGKAQLWRWELAKLRCVRSAQGIVYFGRKEKRKQALALLGIHDVTAPLPGRSQALTALVSELPLPGALRVPQCLSTVVPLGQRLDEVTASYAKGLRRLIRHKRPHYSAREVQDPTEIEWINRNMLKPYATARHQDGAAQLELDEVRRLAQPQLGRLSVVYAEGEAVACELGCPFTRAGKRYWSAVRFGCTEDVFTNGKRLGETSAISDHLVLEWAIENGFDYLDLGISLARPDGGSIQWKKRRTGTLDMMGNQSYFYVRLPKTGTARFLWDAPLFSVERAKLTLHLGIPDGPTDEEIAFRYREMGFGGLSKVCLHCERPPGEKMLERLRSLYSGQPSPVVVETVLVRATGGGPAAVRDTAPWINPKGAI